MDQKMSNAPVYFALVQAHFNPVAAMTRYVDEIQDRLRREGYPLFNAREITQLTIPGSNQDAKSLQPHIQQQKSWLLTRSDKKAGFVLGPSTITFQTTHYSSHREFIAELLRGLKAVHEAVDLDHVSRLGMRYLDAVLPQQNETVEKYLNPGMHGLDFEAKRQHALSESVFATDVQPLVAEGTLVVRVYLRAQGQLGFPPGISPEGLALNPAFDMKTPCAHGVIDTDHFCQGHIPLQFDGLEKQLLSLHTQVSAAFKAVATDHARRVWA